MVVCPGFIDIQSHSIIPLMVDGRCLSKITQGVTTEIMGEAWTPAPFGGRIDRAASTTHRIRRAAAPSGASGRAAGRASATGWTAMDGARRLAERRLLPRRRHAAPVRQGHGRWAQPSADELAIMRRVMAEAMEDGAFGVSYALIYPPDCLRRHRRDRRGLPGGRARTAASTSRTCAPRRTSSSRRGGGARDRAARRAAGRDLPPQGGRRGQLAQDAGGHRRASTPPAPRGMDVTADMYPYIACGTGLSAVLPPWAAAERQALREPARPGDARQDPRRRWKTRPATGSEMLASGRDPARHHADRLRAAGEPAVRRQAPVRDRRGARPGLDRRRHRPAGLGGASASARSTSR